MLKVNAHNILKKREKQIYYLLMLVIYSVFVIPQQFRMGILGDGLGTINLIGSLMLLLLFFLCVSKSNKSIMILAILANIYMLIIGTISGETNQNIIMSLVSFTVPLILIASKIDEKILVVYLEKIIKIINMLIIFITILGIVNYMEHGKVMILISTILSNDLRRLIEAQQMESLIRMYSFMGHPLFNTEIYLIFYSLNMVYSSYFKKLLNNNIVIVISIVGIALTMSKSGFILLLISLFFIGQKKIKLRYLVCLMLVIFILFRIGIFDNIISRFMEGSLSTGRNEAWEIYNNLGIYHIRFFVGYGLSSAYYLNNFYPYLVAAFEYPYRMFSFEHGLLITFIIYMCIGAYPIVKLLKRKHFKVLMAYLIVFVDINTFNGISLPGDYMLVFCIYTFTLLNISDYIYNDIHKS
ncbi:hypothetical protein [Clostridium saccharobutylicum]|uniref:O-antigen ligase n=1 Tax=Clostridium saccharobutylicum TaxID=169679 RepID=A0A1S8NJ83_CLOSA|nr:hypothetical protein [Clostridium saccharobutylicum]OOM16545.1 hypothetical protein CLOSAC_08160 [Clostridium saccharobutylicum]